MCVALGSRADVCCCPLRPQASQAGPEQAAAAAASHAQLLLRQGDAAAAAAVLAKHGVSADAALLPLYRDLALEVLGAGHAARNVQAEQDVRWVVHCVVSRRGPMAWYSMICCICYTQHCMQGRSASK